MSEQSRRQMNAVNEVISLDDPRFDRREADAIPWTRADLRMLIELNKGVADLRHQHDRQDERLNLALMELTSRVTSLEATRYQQQGAVVAARYVQPIVSAVMGLAGAAVAIWTGLGKTPTP